MEALLIGLLGLALVDSLNPSAIGVTVYLLLAGDRYVARVLTYLSGVFATYLGIGVLLLLGVTAIADKAGLNKAQAKDALEAFIDSVTASLKAGQEVRLVGFGSFVDPDRYLSTPAAQARPSAMAQTISD